MSDLPIDPRELAIRTYYKKLPNGTLVAYDMVTGKEIGRSGNFDEVAIAAQEGHKYHPVILDRICDRMVEQGKSLYAICGESDMPNLSTVMRWQQNMPEVKDKITLARQMLAESLHDKILDSLDDSGSTRDDIQLGKLKFEKLKYLAGVNNPEIYGNKTTIAGDGAAPIQFVISTGIDRGSDGQNIGRGGELCESESRSAISEPEGNASEGGEAREEGSEPEGRAERGD